MAYEIPHKLAYHEKIMFGLTFKQLVYAFIFLPLIAGITLKTQLHFIIKLILSLNLAALAIGFMFLRLDYWLKIVYHWSRTRIISQEKISSLLPIKEITNDTILTNQKKKLALLKITPLNFAIKPTETKESIMLGFQKFLNSLDFPVQIMMNTEILDLQDYFRHLTTRDAPTQFKQLWEQHKQHLESITTKNGVMNRNFYLVIPEKQDLDIQVQICEKKLYSLGLKAKRLTTKNLLSLIATILPKHTKIEQTANHLKTNTTYSRVIYAHGYPRTVEAGFLDRIVSASGNFDLSLHIDPYDIETMIVNLNKELQKQRADLYAAKSKGVLNQSLEIQYTDTKNILKHLQKGEEKLYNVSLYINCKAHSLHELNLLTKRIEAELNSLLIIPKQPMFRMLDGFLSCTPLTYNKLNISRNVTTKGLSAFFPFTSPFLQADKTGVWLGLNKTNIPIIKDIFTLSNPNGVCLASSGAGKSYMAKLLISRYLLNNTKVMVIDPQGEYAELVHQFKGQRVDLSRDSSTIINPLDLMGHPYHEKRLALMDLMPVMLGDLSEPQKAFLDRAITRAYEDVGITNREETWNRRPPILGDVLHALQRIEKEAISIEKTTIKSLINRLDMYVNGVFSFLNNETKIDFNNQFVCFDISNMPKQVKPTMMFLVLDYIYANMKETLERKLLVLDEAWSLLSRTEDASYIFEIVKTCRKFNLALFLINQEVEGMLTSEAGKSVLANSAFTLLLRQKPSVINNIQKTFFLSEAERERLLTASPGEGLLLMDDDHSEITIVASPEEHKIITTNPDERLRQQKTRNIKKQPVTIDRPSEKTIAQRHKGYFKLENLSKADTEYLLTRGYKEKRFHNIHGKKELYLIKTRGGESEHHAFLTYNIAEYLETIADKVELHVTKKPDIVFTIKGKKYAVEVETGSRYRKDKNKLQAKINKLNKEYRKNWFFVVTNENNASTYNQLAKTFSRTTFVKQFKKWLKTN